MWKKFELYIISLFLLFGLLLIVKTPVCFSGPSHFIGWHELFHKYLLIVICVVFMILGIIYFIRFEYRFRKGAKLLPDTVTAIENINYESVTFLATYIVPLACIDLDKERNPIVLGVILILIGWIYIKTNLFYTNPTLAIWGYQIYKISVTQKQNIIVIIRGKLHKDDSIYLKNIDDKIYFAKRKL